MNSATGSLRIVLTAAAAVSIATLIGIRAAVPAGAQSGQTLSDRSRFVGTYRLIATEVKNASGDWGRTPNSNSIGYITYSDTGHMAVYAVSRLLRFAANAPTGEEAQAALQGTTAYFGSFTVDDTGKSVVHHRAGQLIPGGPVDASYFYDFDGDRFILTPEPAAGAGKDQAANRIVWERLPDPPLSAEAKKFVGFYKLLYTDSYREKDGKEVFHGNRNETQTGSYILYTPSGHMMAHLMNKEGRTKFAGAQPTPDEALGAYRSYTGYFGRFITYENYKPPFVFHSQQGTTNPGREVDATKRFYVFTGNILRLGAPPTLNAAGEMAGSHLYWERLPPIK